MPGKTAQDLKMGTIEFIGVFQWHARLDQWSLLGERNQAETSCGLSLTGHRGSGGQRNP